MTTLFSPADQKAAPDVAVPRSPSAAPGGSGHDPAQQGETKRSAPSRFDGVARGTAISWALVYSYLVLVAPAPDPDVAITTVQNVLGWVLTGAILTVFASSFFGRRLAGLTIAASAVGGSVLAYNGIDCIMAGHTETMFYVMTVAGAGFVLHALARARVRLG